MSPSPFLDTKQLVSFKNWSEDELLAKVHAEEVVAIWDDSMPGHRKFPVFQFDPRIDSVLLDQMKAEFKHFEVPLGQLWHTVRVIRKDLRDATLLECMLGEGPAEFKALPLLEQRQMMMEICSEELSRLAW